VLGRPSHHIPDAADTLPPPASTAADLARMDALAKTDKGRHTMKARVGERSVTIWALRSVLVWGQTGERAAPQPLIVQ
jgi:hypothetical protein